MPRRDVGLEWGGLGAMDFWVQAPFALVEWGSSQCRTWASGDGWGTQAWMPAPLLRLLGGMTARMHVQNVAAARQVLRACVMLFL